MNTTELQNKIAELEKEFGSKLEFAKKSMETRIAELKSAIAEQGKKMGRWVPELEELYYFIDSTGSVCSGSNTGHSVNKLSVNKLRINSGNCFQTREESEAHQLIAVPKGDADQMLWMVDYLRAASVHLTGKDLHHDGTAFHVRYGISREWVDRHGGEAEVARRLKIGWPK